MWTPNFRLSAAGADAVIVPKRAAEACLALFGLGAHAHVRSQARLFDVEHMVKTTFVLRYIPSWHDTFEVQPTPSSLTSLPAYTSTLSVLLDPQGGIIDDTFVTKRSVEAFYIVTNAGRREEDHAWITLQLRIHLRAPAERTGQWK